MIRKFFGALAALVLSAGVQAFCPSSANGYFMPMNDTVYCNVVPPPFAAGPWSVESDGLNGDPAPFVFYMTKKKNSVLSVRAEGVQYQSHGPEGSTVQSLVVSTDAAGQNPVCTSVNTNQTIGLFTCTSAGDLPPGTYYMTVVDDQYATGPNPNHPPYFLGWSGEASE